MNKQQAINLLKNLEQSLDDYCELNDEGKTAFRMAIEALNCSEFPNNSDTISRQAAIDGKICIQRANGVEIYDDYAVPVEYLKQLPSAQPDIIYCGECAKMKVDSVFHDCWCSETGKKVWINHYCGYAERREVTT